MPNYRLATLCLAIFAIGSSARASDESAVTIRQITSKHLTLFTDLPPQAEIDSLGEIFDQAFPQWCAYFGVDGKQHVDWRMRGYLMQARERFEKAGMVPRDLPNFLNGYVRGDQLWIYDQTSAYYRRHLLLHEGTHAFMDQLSGGRGEPWYAEGMAELLATHKFENNQVTLNDFPRDRAEVPKWGRIEIVQQGYAGRHALNLDKIVELPGTAFLENAPYGWSWAAAAFFDGHSRYRQRFRELARSGHGRHFNEEFMKLFAPDWKLINEHWQVFVSNLDYGYDFEREDFEPIAGKPIGAKGASVEVKADRGWQPSGVQIKAGRTYRLRASGRYQLASEPRVWWCEPGGVTIRYYRSQPLGILQAAIRSDDPDHSGTSGLLKPITVGLATTLKPRESGTLYFRINDSPGSLADNSGSLNVEVTSQ